MATRLKRRSLLRLTGATLAGVGLLNAGRVAASGFVQEHPRFWAVYRGVAGRALNLDTPGGQRTLPLSRSATDDAFVRGRQRGLAAFEVGDEVVVATKADADATGMDSAYRSFNGTVLAVGHGELVTSAKTAQLDADTVVRRYAAQRITPSSIALLRKGNEVSVTATLDRLTGKLVARSIDVAEAH